MIRNLQLRLGLWSSFQSRRARHALTAFPRRVQADTGVDGSHFEIGSVGLVNDGDDRAKLDEVALPRIDFV